MGEWHAVLLRRFLQSDSLKIRAVGEALQRCSACETPDCPGLDHCNDARSIVSPGDDALSVNPARILGEQGPLNL